MKEHKMCNVFLQKKNTVSGTTVVDVCHVLSSVSPHNIHELRLEVLHIHVPQKSHNGNYVWLVIIFKNKIFFVQNVENVPKLSNIIPEYRELSMGGN